MLVRGRSMQSLVQSLQGQCSSPLCFLSLSTTTSSASLIQQAWQATFTSCRSLHIARLDFLCREGRYEAYSYRRIVNSLCNSRYRGLNGVRPEISESESFGCISFYCGSSCASSRELGLFLVETKVCPACKETSPTQNKCCICSNDQPRDCVRDKKDGREMFDSYFDNALQYCDCMLRNKLLESDEEGTLECDGTLDESQPEKGRKKLAGCSKEIGKDFHVRS